MRILEIVYNLSSGGLERFVVDLANQLSKTSDVTIVSIKDDGMPKNSFYKSEIGNNVRYKRFDSKISFRYFFDIYIFLIKEKPNVVHFNGTNLPLYFLLPILFYRKCKYFQTIHIDVSISDSTRSFFFLKQFLYRLGFVKICAISKYNQKKLNETFNINNTITIVNGRNNMVVSPNIYNVRKEIDLYKATKNTICFIHIGRCAIQKNQTMLIEAFNQFSKKYDSILLIIGNGFDNQLGKSLKMIANDKVFFLGEKNNIADWLCCSDAFCLSSLYEGLPISLIEAFSQQCIPISTPVSGCIDYIIDGETGYISDNFNTNNYLETMERYINNRNKINKKLLLKLYNENFTMKHCTNNYINWFNKK
ncbi:glycosyl transferase [Bacteroidia bacterium]|nr:glycosyl transferase [Bacteroidia bacterium]